MGTSTTVTAATVWANAQSISTGDRRTHTNASINRLYEAQNSGTTATGSEPTHGSGDATGADGITWTYIADIDYTSISAWEAAEQLASMSGSGETRLTCYKSGNADTTAVDINGWGDTTASGSSADYLYIYVPPGERHTGTAATGYYLDVTGSGFNHTDGDVYVRVNGLAAKASLNGFISGGTTDAKTQWENCLAYDCTTNGFFLRNTSVAWNCIAINCVLGGNTAQGGFAGENPGGGNDSIFVHCTALNSEENGFLYAGASSRNNVAAGSLRSGDHDFDSPDASADYGFCEDGSTVGPSGDNTNEYHAEGATPTGDYLAFKNITLGSEDAELIDLGHGTHNNVAMGAGQDLSASGLPIWTSPHDPRATDFTGTTSRAATPDAGAFEIPAAAPGATRRIAGGIVTTATA